MLIDEIRQTAPKVLSPEQREFYWENGYLLLEKIIPDEWLDRLRAATDEQVERSRALTASDAVFDLEPNHTAEEPRLRRVTSPVDQHPRLLGLRARLGARRRRRRPRRAGREVPPLQAQLQMGSRAAPRSSGTRTSGTGRTPTTAR